MSTEFVLGYNAKLYYRSTGSGAYTLVAQTKDLNSPESEVAKVKITNNDSPNNTQEYAAGMIDPGDMEYDAVYTPTQQATLYAFKAATPSTTLYWKEIYQDGSGWAFTGFISKIGNESKTENEAIMAKVTIVCVTDPVFATTQTSLS